MTERTQPVRLIQDEGVDARRARRSYSY
jgi:hypothetical protein